MFRKYLLSKISRRRKGRRWRRKWRRWRRKWRRWRMWRRRWRRKEEEAILHFKGVFTLICTPTHSHLIKIVKFNPGELINRSLAGVHIQDTVDSRYLELGYLEICETRRASLNKKYTLIVFSNHNLALETFLQVH